ncbi:MAG: DNA polymerase III subunit gamma/tau [Pseudomonadota bacterium]
MAYQVLARRWRPGTFAELVGQTHVVQALQNALRQQQVHHAYLFTGTRGVGKTTLARILAKALNCETGVTPEPCGTCAVCQAVDAGRFVDLIEVDAASKTGVEDTRELLDNVPYAPTQGRFKVYLIDEVHMFSKHSFNALLKTLEEPPSHVKFLLATTDPQKLPVTILSRCLQFSLKHLSMAQIAAQFGHILQTEQITAEPEALDLLARAADGSMRDGLSLLDQAIAFGAGTVRHEDVRQMLGIVMTDLLPGILTDVQQGDVAAALDKVQQVAQQTPDFHSLTKELLLLLHHVSLLQAVPTGWQAGWGDETTLRQLAALLSPEDSQLYYQIALHGLRDLPLAPTVQSGFEMIILRMHAFRPAAETTQTSLKPTVAAPVAQPQVAPVVPAPAVSQSKPPVPDVPPPLGVAAPDSAPSVPAAASASTTDFGDWHQIVPQLSLVGMTQQLAQHATLQSWDGKTLHLLVQPQVASLIGSRSEQKLQQALKNYHGKPLKLRLTATQEQAVDSPVARQAAAQAERQRAAEQSMTQDPMVQALQQTFDAQIVPGSIRPLAAD